MLTCRGWPLLPWVSSMTLPVPTCFVCAVGYRYDARSLPCTAASADRVKQAVWSREACLQCWPAALGATPAARGNGTGLAALRAAFPLDRLADTGADRLWAFGAPLNGTLDGWLLDHWYNGVGRDDALFVRNISDTPQARPKTLLLHF